MPGRRWPARCGTRQRAQPAVAADIVEGRPTVAKKSKKDKKKDKKNKKKK